MGGFHANWIPYFQDIGFSPAVGAWAATAYGVCSISVRLVWGIVADRFPVRYLLVVQALLTAVSIVLFLNITSVTTLVIAGASHGLALGGFFIMRPLIIANYFGRQNLGAINGILRPFVTLSGAVSPLLIAGMFDIFGSYREAFLLATLTWVLAAGRGVPGGAAEAACGRAGLGVGAGSAICLGAGGGQRRGATRCDFCILGDESPTKLAILGTTRFSRSRRFRVNFSRFRGKTCSFGRAPTGLVPDAGADAGRRTHGGRVAP